MKKSMILIIAIVSILVIAAAVGVPLYIYNQNNYVAKVGDYKISKAEYTCFLMIYKARIESVSGVNSSDEQAVKSFWKSKATEGETWEESARTKTLDQLKQQKILYAKAVAKGVKITDDEKKQIKQQIDNTVTQQYSGKRVEADKAYKNLYGVNLSQYEQISREYMIISKYQQSELSDIKNAVTDDEVSKTYNENPKLFDKFSVRHILYMTVDTTTRTALSEDKVKEAQDKANAMKQRVLAGEDMAKLAKENSQDTGVSENEGLYTFDKYATYDKDGKASLFSETGSDLDTNFKAWPADKNVGDVGIVQSQYGYHVMKLENRVTQSFDAVKDNLKSEVAETKFNNNIEEWKKDPKNDLKTNNKVYNTIKILK